LHQCAGVDENRATIDDERVEAVLGWTMRMDILFEPICGTENILRNRSAPLRFRCHESTEDFGAQALPADDNNAGKR
jgi:hypothetical protein